MFSTIIIIFLTMNGFNVPDELYNSAFITENQVIEMFSDQESECLAKTLYFEARGESEEGIYAVADVVLNRKLDKKYPDTICGVVNQKGQFTYNHSLKPKNERVYQRMKYIAIKSIFTHTDNGILYYHNTTVSPKWSKRLKKVAKIDNHVFYKRKS
jgi:spore germination cell wall hydrolase CwlJ-like protein